MLKRGDVFDKKNYINVQVFNNVIVYGLSGRLEENYEFNTDTTGDSWRKYNNVLARTGPKFQITSSYGESGSFNKCYKFNTD